MELDSKKEYAIIRAALHEGDDFNVMVHELEERIRRRMDYPPSAILQDDGHQEALTAMADKELNMAIRRVAETGNIKNADPEYIRNQVSKALADLDKRLTADLSGVPDSAVLAWQSTPNSTLGKEYGL